MSPIHASVIFSFPEFAEFSESSAPFRKNSNDCIGWTWQINNGKSQSLPIQDYGLFPLPEMDSDSKPYHYIGLCRNFHIGSDLDVDPYSDIFPNGYCTHFRDGSMFQRQISIPNTYIFFNRVIRILIQTNGRILHSTGICIRIRTSLQQWK